jgi:hypothetical protein
MEFSRIYPDSKNFDLDESVETQKRENEDA